MMHWNLENLFKYLKLKYIYNQFCVNKKLVVLVFKASKSFTK